LEGWAALPPFETPAIHNRVISGRELDLT